MRVKQRAQVRVADGRPPPAAARAHISSIGRGAVGHEQFLAKALAAILRVGREHHAADVVDLELRVGR